jgi:TonB-dependent receptor
MLMFSPALSRAAMCRGLRALALGVSLSALSAGLAQAGELRGRVVDANTGARLEGATVRIAGSGREAVSDRDGGYTITGLPAGAYQVTVGYVGYAPVTQTVQVTATGAVVGDFRIGAEVGASEVAEIVVTGTRAAQAQALQTKRTAPQIIEAISADDVGKLPDANLADALQRVPGLATSIDQGEGRYITIRGIDPDLNNVTVNGQLLGTPEGGGRRVPLDTFPSDVISAVEVIKAPTPDLDAQGIGGTINIVTPSAFDRAGPFLFGSVDVGYNELSGKNPYGGSLSGGRTFGAAEQYGVVLAASYSFRGYESDNVEATGWRLLNGFYAPQVLGIRDYSIERERIGLVGNFEYRPRDGVQLYLNNTFTRYADDEERDTRELEFAVGPVSEQTATSGRYRGGRGVIELRSRKVVQTLYNLSAGGEVESGLWTVDFNGTYAKAVEDTPRRIDWEFRSAATAFPNVYDVSGEFLQVDAGPNVLDPARYPFRRVRRRTDDVQDDTYTASLDLQRDFGARPGFVKAGVRYVTRDKSWDRTNDDYAGTTRPLLLSEVDKPGASEHLDGLYEFGPTIDFGQIEALFNGSRDIFRPNPQGTAVNSLALDYGAQEDVLAGYGMASFEFGEALSVIAGLRVEHTEAEYYAFDLQFEDGDLIGAPRRETTAEYTNVLPGLHLRYEASDQLLIRAAYTNTIGRPNFEDVVPRREFEFDENSPGVFQGAIDEGNSDLDPYESMNLDFSAEYYLTPAGIVAVGLFYKSIENPIFVREVELEDVTEGDLFFSDLTRTRPENAEKGTILGIELNYQQQFTFLPSPLDGFGLAANYTYTDSEAEVFGRTDELPFFRQSDHIGNVALYYEKYGLDARLALAYRSEYLDILAGGPGTDAYIDDRAQLDFKAAYDINDRFEVFGEVTNINDVPLRYLSGGDDNRVAANEVYSWSAAVGLNFKF